MHPYINKEDCYYTYTDSVVLGHPLPEDVISKDELGKLKLEYKVKEGIFNAPKSYWLDEDGSKDVLVHKGVLKSHVTKEWFQEQYRNPSMTKKVVVRKNFRRDLKSLTIKQQEYESTLGMPCSTKREKVYDKDGMWVDTKTFEICTHDDDQNVKVNAYMYKRGVPNQERTSQDANDNQNGSFEKQHTYTEIGKTTQKNKQDLKVYNEKNKVSKRVRRTKQPDKVSKRR